MRVLKSLLIGTPTWLLLAGCSVRPDPPPLIVKSLQLQISRDRAEMTALRNALRMSGTSASTMPVD